jgi:hypothetical protein
MFERTRKTIFSIRRSSLRHYQKETYEDKESRFRECDDFEKKPVTFINMYTFIPDRHVCVASTALRSRNPHKNSLIRTRPDFLTGIEETENTRHAKEVSDERLHVMFEGHSSNSSHVFKNFLL